MNILVTIPTIYSEKSCLDFLRNIESPSKKYNIHILLIDNSIATYSSKFFDYVGNDKRIFYFKPTINLGFSNSVNMGLYFGYKVFNFQYVIFANDDIIIKDKNEFNRFMDFVVNSKENVILTDFGAQKSPWSLMVIKKKCFEDIGGFDSLLFPTCCEDKDYNMRYLLKYKIKPGIFKSRGFSHTVKSRPIKVIKAVSFPGFKMCLPYFKDKWRGTSNQYLNLFHFDPNGTIKHNEVSKAERDRYKTPGYDWFYNDDHK